MTLQPRLGNDILERSRMFIIKQPSCENTLEEILKKPVTDLTLFIASNLLKKKKMKDI